MKKLDVAVIVINYNSSFYTIQCIQSILKTTPRELSYQIIIVDNNSEKKDFDRLSILSEYPKIKIIRSKFNLGFSGGHMFGIQFTEASYYFFLNSDCFLMNDCLSVLHAFCEKNNKVALCSPQLFSEKMKRARSFDYFPTLATKVLGTGILRFFSKKSYPDKNKTYEKPLKVDLVSGATLFVRADAFFEIGGFDTNYFLYCEEEDLAFRFSKKSYDVFLVPQAEAQHFGGGSTKKSLNIDKEFYISFLYFYRKNYGFLNTLLLRIYLFIKLAKKSLKHNKYQRLALFVVSGACLSNSLRHQQKARP